MVIQHVKFIQSTTDKWDDEHKFFKTFNTNLLLFTLKLTRVSFVFNKTPWDFNSGILQGKAQAGSVLKWFTSKRQNDWLTGFST